MSTRQEVVLKVVFPDPDLDPAEAANASPTKNQLNSFKREIEILSMINDHPNIACLLGITSDFRVVVLEEAMIDLHKMVKSQKRGLSASIVTRWSHELLAGTAYLHSIQIMHRDLKPSNLLIYKDMTLKICDFGLACQADVTESLAVRREMCTVWYRAPELIMGAEEYSSKIDVWSCGVIILEMLLGRCPTAGRVEDVCKCPKQTHFNFNSDQLAKTFKLVGTPTDNAFLEQMHCRSHFKLWPTYPSRLEEVITNALLMLADRSRAQESGKTVKLPAASTTDLKGWLEIISMLLTTNPVHRTNVARVLEHDLWKSLLSNDAGAEQQHPSPQRSKLTRAVSNSAAQTDGVGRLHKGARISHSKEGKMSKIWTRNDDKSEDWLAAKRCASDGYIPAIITGEKAQDGAGSSGSSSSQEFMCRPRAGSQRKLLNSARSSTSAKRPSLQSNVNSLRNIGSSRGESADYRPMLPAMLKTRDGNGKISVQAPNISSLTRSRKNSDQELGGDTPQGKLASMDPIFVGKDAVAGGGASAGQMLRRLRSGH